jgi:hypothetical protein
MNSFASLKRDPSARRQFLLLALILLLATLLRIGWPRLTEFKFSEARLQALALELTREGHLPLVGVPSSAGFDHSPISVYLYVPAFLLTASPIPATVYGGLVGVAAVVLCWWLARWWPGGGHWSSVVAALLFAVSPWAVAFSRKIWQVTFVPLICLAFIGLMVSALVQGRRWSLAWGLVVFAVLVQVHPSAVSLGLALALWLIVFWRQVKLAPLLLGGAMAALTFAPFLTHQVMNDWPALAALRGLPAGTWDLSALYLAWEAISGRGIHALAGDAYPLLRIVPQLGWTFHLVGWLTVAGVLWLAWRMVVDWRAADRVVGQAARTNLILLSWLLVPILFNLRHSLDLYLHFFALVMPAAYLAIGRASQGILDRTGAGAERAIKVAGSIVLGLVVVGQVAALGMMARFVATHDTPGGFERPLGHYLDLAAQVVEGAEKSGAAEVLIVGEGDSPVVDEAPAIFDVLLRGRVPYRFVNGKTASLFPTHRSLVLLAPGAEDAARWYATWPASDLGDGYHVVMLDGSWPGEALEPVSGQRLFQNGIELQGYDWQSDAGLGREDQVWLGWQVLWQSPDDTHFFVHLLDDEQQVLRQQDGVGYPTAYRRKGDRIISRFDVGPVEGRPLAPTSLRVGVYLYPQVVNVPLIDGAGNPSGDAILLGPAAGDP